jgi:hypothetical protein
MVYTPLEEAAGSVIKHIPGISKIAAKAPRHGAGLGLQAEVNAVRGFFTKGMKDALETVKQGQSNLDLVYGRQEEFLNREWVDYIGSLHGALKAPTMRAEFERSLQLRTEHAARNGVDITDPMTQLSLQMDAYRDGQRAIFKQDNAVVDAYKRGIAYLKQPVELPDGTKEPRAKALATAAEIMLPVVRIPANIVAETFEHILGPLAHGKILSRLAKEGIENLSADDADILMRSLKKGTLGGAALTLGYLCADQFGGFFQRGKKSEPGEVKYGEARIPGKKLPAVVGGPDVPDWMLDNTFMNTVMVGATARKVADSSVKGESQGIGNGILAGTLGLVDEVPFVREMTEMDKVMTPSQRGKWVDSFVSSLFVPQAATFWAKYKDKDAEGHSIIRDPEGLWQTIQASIPGHGVGPIKGRKDLPEKP